MLYMHMYNQGLNLIVYSLQLLQGRQRTVKYETKPNEILYT